MSEWEPSDELVEKCADLFAIPMDDDEVALAILKAAVESGELVARDDGPWFRSVVHECCEELVAARKVVEAARHAGLIGWDNGDAMQGITNALDAYDAATRNDTEEK